MKIARYLWALPAVIAAGTDLVLWNLAGPLRGAPLSHWGFLSWPQTIPAAARALIEVGSRPWSALTQWLGWQWQEAGVDWLAWSSCVAFWFAWPIVLAMIDHRWLRWCLRIGITKALGTALLVLDVSWGRLAVPVLRLQWLLMAILILLALTSKSLKNKLSARGAESKL